MRTIILAVVFLLSYHHLSAQINKIKAFENGLTETRTIIFEDSLIARYNIIDRMKHYKVPSVSIALINNGKIEWVKAYGYIDAENKVPANTATVYQAASITKSVNALGIMKLVQKGQLSLQKDIRHYLKTWMFQENEFSTGRTITLKQLLSHTAGFGVRGFYGYPSKDSLPTINQILDGQKPANNEAVRPIIAAGTQFEYSGGGSTIVRKILDDNISNNYDSLMRTLVLKPLRMNRSSFAQPPGSKHKNFAFAHDKEMRVIPGKYYIYPEQAAGGLWATAKDIARFVIAVQESLNERRSSLLSKNEALEMLNPVLEQSAYALGFGIENRGGEKYFRHDGENYGFTASYYGSFSTGKGVVILTNAYPENGRPLITEIVNSIAENFEWKNFYQPIVKKLVVVPENLLDQYTGDYYSEKPEMKISITRKNNELELKARRPEKMFATAFNTFFLASSPGDDCVFSASEAGGLIDTLEVIQNGKLLIRAKKIK